MFIQRYGIFNLLRDASSLNPVIRPLSLLFGVLFQNLTKYLLRLLKIDSEPKPCQFPATGTTTIMGPDRQPSRTFIPCMSLSSQWVLAKRLVLVPRLLFATEGVSKTRSPNRNSSCRGTALRFLASQCIKSDEAHRGSHEDQHYKMASRVESSYHTCRHTRSALWLLQFCSSFSPSSLCIFGLFFKRSP